MHGAAPSIPTAAIIESCPSLIPTPFQHPAYQLLAVTMSASTPSNIPQWDSAQNIDTLSILVHYNTNTNANVMKDSTTVRVHAHISRTYACVCMDSLHTLLWNCGKHNTTTRKQTQILWGFNNSTGTLTCFSNIRWRFLDSAVTRTHTHTHAHCIKHLQQE